MPPRMIRVRHKETGEFRLLGETAFPYFAGIYERVEEQPADSGQSIGTGEPAATAGDGGKSVPATGKSTGRRAATTEMGE